MSPELKELIEKSVVMVKAMTPEQRDAMLAEQIKATLEVHRNGPYFMGIPIKDLSTPELLRGLEGASQACAQATGFGSAIGWAKLCKHLCTELWRRGVSVENPYVIVKGK